MERPTCGFRGRTTGRKSRPGHGLFRLRPRLDARVRTALSEAAGLAVSFPPPAASLPAALTAPCRPMTPAQALRPVTPLDNCLPDIYTWALHGDLRVPVVTMKPTIASGKTSMIPSFKQLLILCLGVAPPTALIVCLLGPPPVSDGTASLQGPDSEPAKGGISEPARAGAPRWPLWPPHLALCLVHSPDSLSDGSMRILRSIAMSRKRETEH